MDAKNHENINQIRLSLLGKSLWSVSEVAKYYGVSNDKARRIVVLTNNEYRPPKYSGYLSAKADGVIKLMGGVSREDEIKVIKNAI